MADKQQYQTLLTLAVQKQMVILGPQIALDVARKVAGLTVADDGSVTSLSGDPQMVFKSLVGEYVTLAGPIIQSSLNDIIKQFNSINTSTKY